MANPNFNDILTTTLDNHRSEMIDNVFGGNPLTYWLQERGRVRMVRGGAKIVAPIMYAGNDSSSSYSGAETLSYPNNGGFTAAEFDWKQHAVTISINGFEEFRNQGEHEVVDLLESRVKQAELTATEDFETMFLSDGTGNGGKDMLGLAALVGDESSTVTSVGGIDAATQAFWRSNVRRGETFGLGLLNEVYLSVSKAGKDTVDLILSGPEVYAAHEALLQPALRFTDTKLADAGFDNIAFKRARHVFTDNAALAATVGASTTADVYLVNSNYLQLVGGEGRWFQNTPFITPPNQDARYSHILSIGNLTVTNRARQAKLEGVVL